MYSHFFEELKTNIGPRALTHPMWFLVRRFFMGLIVVVFRNSLIFQVMLKAASIITSVIIIGAVPFETRKKKNTEFFNEVIIMFVMYSILCFSPFVPDIGARSKIGFFCCIVVALHLLANLSIILLAMARDVKIKVKFFFARKKLRRDRASNLIAIKTRKHRRTNNIPD